MKIFSRVALVSIYFLCSPLGREATCEESLTPSPSAPAASRMSEQSPAAPPALHAVSPPGPAAATHTISTPGVDSSSGTLRSQTGVITPPVSTAHPADEFQKTAKRPMNGIGVTAGLISGLGFSYRKYDTGNSGYHIGFVAFADRSSADIYLGLQYLHVIDQGRTVKFYLLGGLGIFNYSRTKTLYYNKKSESYVTDTYSSDIDYTKLNMKKVWSSDFNFGAGIGIEWKPNFGSLSGLAFSVELPLVTTFTNDENGLAFSKIWPIPAATIIYYLN